MVIQTSNHDSLQSSLADIAPVSSVTWVENHVFLVVHNPTNQQEASVYHVITRQQPPGGAPPTFTFQKITDPVEPFGSDKAPHHSVLRLKDFPPNLQDLLLVSSTATENIGLLSRSKTPLASDKPADSIINCFTTTELADDSKRAALPMSEDLMETFPIGIALDLSSKDKVYKPIPTDEIDQSPGPLPGLWVLNNEGVLCSWWVVYNESIRSGTSYPGLAVLDSTSQLAPALASQTESKPFGTPAKPAPAFGTSIGTPATAFGTPGGAVSAFGGSSALGTKPSPWSTGAGQALGSASFGKPSFGSTPAAPAFGHSTVIGMGPKASPWASGSTAGAAPAFGQAGFAGSSTTAAATPGKVFGSAATTAPATGGFSAFASKGGFASLGGASTQAAGGSIFGSKPGSAFASSTPEVSMDTDTAFPPPSAKPKSDGALSLGSSPFVLGTTFKADPDATKDDEKPEEAKKSSMFGTGFGLTLSDASKEPSAPQPKDEEMDTTAVAAAPKAEERSTNVFGAAKPSFAPVAQAPTQERLSNIFGSPAREEKPKSMLDLGSTTPTTTPAPQRFSFNPSSGISSGSSNIFGLSKPSAPASGTSNIFGAPKPTQVEAKPASPFGFQNIKKEEEDKENLANVPEAPLPPAITSKTALLPLGDQNSSRGSLYSQHAAGSTRADDAPLPPDFVKTPGTNRKDQPRSPEQKAEPAAALLPSGLPSSPGKQSIPTVPTLPSSPESHEDGELSEEEEEEDEEEEEEGTEAASEGSGVDVAKDFSPTAGYSGVTPQSSFGGMAGSTFLSISRSEAEQPRLFGEIGRDAPPLFPQPVPQSPRSPSPVRNGVRQSLFRPAEPQRAVSTPAPGLASQFLARKSQGPSSLRAPPVDPNVETQRRIQAKKDAEARVLVDPEDEGIRQILHSEIEPTLHMDEFLAVDSKLEAMGSKTDREEVPVACETLWRDINRMVDRLGLNSRSLQAFILGHTQQFKASGRHKEDLERPDDWVLVEAEDLGLVVDNELAQDLEDGRIKDVKGTEGQIQQMIKDLTKLRAKEEDLRKIIMAHVDPDQVAIAKALALSSEQAAQQNELRRAYAEFSRLLSETEEALTLLKAKIASAGGPSGRTQVPTVEAIIRTINKMTSMAEKRSVDVDVLENQMRRLRFSSASLNGSPGVGNSREGSPFVGSASTREPMTPQQHRRSMLLSMSPLKNDSPFGASVASYSGRGATPSPRKKMSMYTEEEKTTVKERERKRKNMLGLLRSSLERTGGNVQRLRDDD